MNDNAGIDAGTVKGRQGLVRIRGAVSRRKDAADAMMRQRRREFPESRGIDHLLVGESISNERRDLRSQFRQFGLVLGNQQLTVGAKAAVVADQAFHVAPHLHCDEGSRQFSSIATQRPHARSGGAG